MIRGLKIQAVDAYVAHNRWLLLVMPEWVYMIEVERLMDKNRQVNGHTGEATFGEEMQSYESKVMNSPWEQSDISSAWEQSDVSMSLATVG